MSSINAVVEVNVETQTKSVAKASFNIPMLVAHFATTVFANRVRTYDISSGLTGLVDDGFATSHPVYKMAEAFAAQQPKIKTLKVGRRGNASTMTLRITPQAQNSVTYAVTINKVTYEYTSDANALLAEVCTGIAAAINAGTEPVTADGTSGTHVDLTADVPGACFTVSLADNYDGAALMSREDRTTDPGLAADLNAIQLEDNNFYLLCLDSQSKAEQGVAAAWAQTAKKLFVTTTGDTDVKSAGTTDIAATTKASNYDRTYVVYDQNPHMRCAEAWAGLMLPKNPGSATWKFKTPVGPWAQQLTATEIANLESKNCNYFSNIGGVDIMSDGKVAVGEWIDIVRGIDWWKARLQERVFARQVNTPKIPFDNEGIMGIESDVWAQIQEGQSPQYRLLDKDREATVTVPDSIDVSAQDKIDRKLQGVTFQAYLAGAIHYTGISGVVAP